MLCPIQRFKNIQLNNLKEEWKVLFWNSLYTSNSVDEKVNILSDDLNIDVV